MRTFHTGGVAGTDITQGLPRVEEIFEARKPKGLAIITEFSGVANIKDTKKKREIVVTNNETGESKAYLIPYGSRIKVMDGAVLELSLIHICGALGLLRAFRVVCRRMCLYRILWLRWIETVAATFGAA